MTREEAIKVLDCARSILPNKAVDMAIEALSAEYEDYEHATLVDIKEPLRVAVVRCKDCCYWDRENQFCTDGGGLILGVTENDYCSRAVRREE